MSADVFMFDSDKAEESMARRHYSDTDRALIRQFLDDPKLRVRPSEQAGGLSPEGAYVKAPERIG